MSPYMYVISSSCRLQSLGISSFLQGLVLRAVMHKMGSDDLKCAVKWRKAVCAVMKGCPVAETAKCGWINPPVHNKRLKKVIRKFCGVSWNYWSFRSGNDCAV